MPFFTDPPKPLEAGPGDYANWIENQHVGAEEAFVTQHAPQIGASIQDVAGLKPLAEQAPFDAAGNPNPDYADVGRESNPLGKPTPQVLTDAQKALRPVRPEDVRGIIGNRKITVSPFDTYASLQAKSDQTDADAWRAWIADRRNEGTGEWLLNGAASFGTALTDPLSYIPMGGEAWRTAVAMRGLGKAAQYGLGGAIGAGEMVGIGAAALPLQVAGQKAIDDDVTYASALHDLLTSPQTYAVGGLAGMAGTLMHRMSHPHAPDSTFAGKPPSLTATPEELAAVAHVESGGNPDAVSSAGAVGRMQVMPAAARDAAKRLGASDLEGLSDEQVQQYLKANPAAADRLGSTYYQMMLEKYDGNRTLARAAYNAGEGNVNKWIAEHGDPRTGAVSEADWVAKVPYRETRDYVGRVAAAEGSDVPVSHTMASVQRELGVGAVEAQRIANERNAAAKPITPEVMGTEAGRLNAAIDQHLRGEPVDVAGISTGRGIESTLPERTAEAAPEGATSSGQREAMGFAEYVADQKAKGSTASEAEMRLDHQAYALRAERAAVQDHATQTGLELADHEHASAAERVARGQPVEEAVHSAVTEAAAETHVENVLKTESHEGRVPSAEPAGAGGAAAQAGQEPGADAGGAGGHDAAGEQPAAAGGEGAGAPAAAEPAGPARGPEPGGQPARASLTPASLTPEQLDSAERVGDEITRQLVASGMSLREAAPQAALWKSFFEAIGGRAGVDPWSLFSQYRVAVAREHGAPIHKEGALFQFAGEKAKGADLEALERAKKLEAEGVDAREIWKREGWFKGPDGKWRWEINDSGAWVTAEPPRIGHPKDAPEVLDHPELYAAYPDLAKIRTRLEKGRGGGRYLPASDDDSVPVIQVNGRDRADARSTLLHEMQHGVQHVEGFQRGGNEIGAVIGPLRKEFVRLYRERVAAITDPGTLEHFAEVGHYDSPEDARADYAEHVKTLAGYRRKGLPAWLDKAAQETAQTETYRRLAGEAEARAVQARADMTPEERRATFPLDSYDVPPDQLIMRGGSADQTLFQGGLDMSQEARMKRAEAQGFDTSKVLYHGTTGDFPAFSAKHKGRETGAPSAGEAYFLASNPKVASGYAYEATPRPFQKGSKPLTQGMKQAIDRLRYEAERDARKAADHARMDAYNQAQATLGEHMDKDAVHRFLSGHATVTAMEAVNKSLIDQTLSEGRWRAIHEGGVTVREIYDAEDVGRDLVGETLRKIDPKAEEAYQRAKYFGYGKNKEDIKTVPLDDRAPAMAEKLQALRDRVVSFESREQHVGTPEGANVIPVYARIRNPLVHDMRGREYRDASYYDLIKQAKDEGRDGVIIRNTSDPANSRFDEQTDIHIPFKSNQIRSVHAAFEPEASRRADLLAQGETAQPRGSISFGEDGKTVIRLFQQADASTFLHESAHFFMRVLRDLGEREGMPEDLANDWKTLRDWLGVKDGEALSVEHEEKLARGFESYLRDGKAPTSALRQVFETIKDWLHKVYQSLSDLGVLPSPEVKGVFDRMLGGDPEALRTAVAARDDPLAEQRALLARPEPKVADPLAEPDYKLDYDVMLAAGHIGDEARAEVDSATAELERAQKLEPAYRLAASCALGVLMS